MTKLLDTEENFDIMKELSRRVFLYDDLYKDYFDNGQGKSVTEYITDNFDRLMDKFPRLKVVHEANRNGS